jgi:hypothetical protein
MVFDLFELAASISQRSLITPIELMGL